MKRRQPLAIFLLLMGLFSALTFGWFATSNPTRDSVILKSYNSLPDAVQGILRREVDLLPINQIDLQTLQPLMNNTQVSLVRIPSFGFTYIGLNLRNWPLRDRYMRKAMLYAFNRPKVVNQVLGGLGEALQPSLFSSAYSALGWPNFTDHYGYDPSKAEMLLNSEGFIKSAPFRLDPSTGDTLRSMQIISRLSRPGEVAAADLFAKDMQAIGLPIVSVPMSDRDFDQAIRIYSFDIFIDSKRANSAPTWLYDLFASKNDVSPVPLGSNLVGYRSSSFDDYVRELVTGKSQSDIVYAASKCQETLTADLPAIPVFSEDLLLASSRLPVATIIGSLRETVRSTVVRTLKETSFSPPLRIGLASAFDDLDPTTSSNQADWIALHLLTEPLLSTDQKGGLEPGLVTQWMVSDTGTSMTLSIRQDAKFENGQSITVNDVAATLNWLIHNVKPSSPLNVLMKEASRAYVLDQKTIRVTLSRPDRFAVNQLTELFALPEARLRSNPNVLDPLRNQLILPSGPLVLREFTQRDGVYMQRSNSYFGKRAENSAGMQVFQQVMVQGFIVLPGSEARISSSPLLLKGQPVTNASYRSCVYDQNDLVTECVWGAHLGYGTYSTILHVDSRFRIGAYNVESTVSGSLADGTFVIFQENTMMVTAFPPVPLLLFIILMVAAVIGVKGRKMVPPRRRQRIQARKA